MFGGGTSECTASVALNDGTLAIGRCACPGAIRSSEPGGKEVGVIDVKVPTLRPPGGPLDDRVVLLKVVSCAEQLDVLRPE